MQVYDITDYGAIADGSTDCRPAMSKLLEDIGNSENATIIFPKGNYYLETGIYPGHTGSFGSLFNISQLKNLTIDGKGSELIFGGIKGVFHFTGCENVRIKDFSIDWKRPPFSVGEVVSSEDGSFVVEVFDEYPVEGGEPVGAYMDYDPETRLPLRNCIDAYFAVSKTELVDTQLLKVYTSDTRQIEPGNLVLLRHQVYGNNALSFDHCTNIEVSGVTIYTCPGMALVAHKCHNLEVHDFAVRIKPDANRLSSVTADALHLAGTTGDINVYDCVFEGMGDDAINTKTGLYLMVEEIVDDRTVIARHNLNMQDLPAPGDTMEFVKNSDVITYASAEVESAEWIDESKSHRVKFKSSLPEALQLKDMIGNASRTAKIRIKNCTVRNNRARGFLIQNRDAVVQDCHFENITSGGVWIFTEVWHFYESITSRYVEVRDCKFINCNYGGPLGTSVLGVFTTVAPNEGSDKIGAHKNIVLEDNLIDGSDNSAIIAESVDNLIIRGNTIKNVCRGPFIDSGHYAIFLQGVQDAVIYRNTALPEDQPESCKSILGFGPGCKMDTIKVSRNTGFALEK